MKPLKIVYPQHLTDCTICSMATIAGITYEKTLKIMLPKRKKYSDYGATLPQIIDCFEKLKIDVRKTKNSTIKELKRHAFLIIRIKIKNREYAHAVVWDAKRKLILDGYHRSKSAKSYQKKLVCCFEIK
jgi:ABC-type bacteriocin/lantibiotic exporter with double-glycine peptidase domain